MASLPYSNVIFEITLVSLYWISIDWLLIVSFTAPTCDCSLGPTNNFRPIFSDNCQSYIQYTDPNDIAGSGNLFQAPGGTLFDIGTCNFAHLGTVACPTSCTDGSTPGIRIGGDLGVSLSVNILYLFT